MSKAFDAEPGIAWVLQQLDGDDRLYADLTPREVQSRGDVREILDEESVTVVRLGLEGDRPGYQSVIRWRGRYVVVGDYLDEFVGPFTSVEAAIDEAFNGLSETGEMIADVSGDELNQWLPLLAGEGEQEAQAICVNGAPAVLQRDSRGEWRWPSAPEGTRVTNRNGTFEVSRGRWVRNTRER